MKIINTRRPDEELFVAELWVEDCHFAEVFIQENVPVVQIYPRQDGQWWKIPVLEIENASSLACKKLKNELN